MEKTEYLIKYHTHCINYLIRNRVISAWVTKRRCEYARITQVGNGLLVTEVTSQNLPRGTSESAIANVSFEIRTLNLPNISRQLPLSQLVLYIVFI
jgi:hypothetical protein